MGIAEESLYRTLITDNEDAPCFGMVGSYSFCGYDKNNMNGTIATTDLYSAEGHEIGREYFVSVETESGRVRIYDERLKTDVSKGNLDPSASYYFYVIMSHPESACAVTLIQ